MYISHDSKRKGFQRQKKDTLFIRRFEVEQGDIKDALLCGVEKRGHMLAAGARRQPYGVVVLLRLGFGFV
jgi:hypothetical protein